MRVKEAAGNTVVQWAVAAMIALLLLLATAFTSRNVYSKDEVDAKFEAVDTKVEYMYEDVKWLVRREGGVPADEQAGN